MCGIADVNRFTEVPRGHHPTDILPGCQSVIVMACRFPVDQLSVADDTYTIARDNMAQMMDKNAIRLTGWLTSRGIGAKEVLSIGQTVKEADGRYRGPLSMKHAGMLAGLGRIGRNSLLINEKHGNMIWISAVVTTAKLDSDPVVDYAACLPDCRRCVQACPVHAFEDQVVRQEVCYAHAFRSESGRQDGRTLTILCNACRVVCPHAFGL